MRLFILFLFFQFTYSQPYRPLLDQTNQWHFTSCYFGCLTDVYYTDGDTVVNNKTHKILDGYHYISRSFLLREEINTKKVYLTKINQNNTNEFLLYDFSLNEGDTFTMINPISPFPLNTGSFVLDSIRMKPLLNNIDYKHFYFSPTASNSISNFNVVWIEGIGSKSLINAPGGEVDINGVGQLSCFFKNEVLVYSNLDSISGCEYQNLSVKSNLFSKIKILKTNKKREFKFTNCEEIKSIELYSINGQRIKSFQNNNNPNFEFSLENSSSGLYFVVIYDEFLRKKVFKISSE